MRILDIVLFTVVGLACFFDLTLRKIPNWLILTSFVAGVSLGGYQGLAAFWGSLAGFVLGLGLFFIPFALGWMGAGDVKLVGVVGCLLGYRNLPRAVFYSILVAGVIALGYLFFDRRSSRVGEGFKNVWGDFKLAVLSRGLILPRPISQKAMAGRPTVPWGVAISAGALIAHFVDPTGRWAGI